MNRMYNKISKVFFVLTILFILQSCSMPCHRANAQKIIEPSGGKQIVKPLGKTQAVEPLDEQTVKPLDEKDRMELLLKKTDNMEKDLRFRIRNLEERLTVQETRLNNIAPIVHENTRRIDKLERQPSAGFSQVPPVHRIPRPTAKADQAQITPADIDAIWAQIHEILNTLDTITAK